MRNLLFYFIHFQYSPTSDIKRRSRNEKTSDEKEEEMINCGDDQTKEQQTIIQIIREEVSQFLMNQR